MAARSTRHRLRSALDESRNVDPAPITGRESSRDLLQKAFPAFVGRQVRTGYELMSRSISEDCAVFCTLSGAMTPAGLHQSCLIPLIRRGMVSCLTTTGANLYHDAHRVLGHAIRELNPESDDAKLRVARIIRIYDLGFGEETLLETDRLFTALLQLPQFQRRMTTPELHYLLGKELYSLERKLKASQPSLLSTCYRYGIPIFVGAVQDGSIFLNMVKLKRLLGEAFQLEIDIVADVFAMAALQHHTRERLGKRLAVWILGGGVPKNYTLQGEPLLSQIFEVPARGFDIDVQICVDPVDNGALSSCPAGEGHTWGKVTSDYATSSVYVKADVTAVLPWLTHALMGDAKTKRAPQRLMDHLHDAIAGLDVVVQKKRGRLLRDLAGPGDAGAAARTRPAAGAQTAASRAPTKRA